VTIASEKPMDMAAATQRIAWLDEERRRDHAELARLAQEMASALTVLKEQSVKMRETGDRIDAVETVLTRIPRLEDAITAARSEMLPLRDADIHLQDELQRQAKDRQSQADQSARVLGDLNARLETLSKSVDGLANRIQIVDSQRKDQAERIIEMNARIEGLIKASDNLTGRIHLLETRERERAGHESEVPTQIAGLVKAADTLGGRIHLLETRERERSSHESEIFTRIAGLVKAADTLSGRIHLLETQERERSSHEGEIPSKIAAMVKAADTLGDRLNVLEVREQDRSNRDAAVTTQLAHLDVSQAQAIEEVKRSVARAESVMTDILQLRHELVLAQQEEDKKHKDDTGLLADMREAHFILQRRVDAIADMDKPLIVRIQDLEAAAPQTATLDQRLLVVEEQISVVQATYKGLQEVEDTHWNTVIPVIQQEAEEANNVSQGNAAAVQELVAASQLLKETVRELQVNLVAEHSYSEDLAAALRGLIEEDLQTRLATTQKQLQTLRRLANTPVESQPTDEQ
jgi:DNA repair exonuclease SbcCD ATPase subunit